MGDEEADRDAVGAALVLVADGERAAVGRAGERGHVRDVRLAVEVRGRAARALGALEELQAQTTSTRLVGRDGEVALVAEALAGGAAPAVLLVGAAGVGKTRLAEECLARLTPRGAKPLRVLATRAAAALLLGALAPLLPRLSVPDAMLLPAARQALVGDGPRPMLFVDDAHHLDPVSAALIQQVVAARRLFAVLTVRSDEPVPDALDALWKDQRALRIDLPPLADADIEELARELLEGAVDLFTGRELTRLAAGNPLALREVITGARRQGTLRHEAGRGWVAHGVISAPPHLVDVVAERVEAPPPPQRAALRLVALGEPIGRALAERLADAAALDALERAGLVTVDTRGLRHEVLLAHPLFGEAATRGMATGDRRALLSRLAGASATRACAGTTTSCGSRPGASKPRTSATPALLLGAARRSLALHDLRSAIRFASAATAVGGGPTAARCLAQQGRQRPAARAAHEARACRERCEEARTPLLATADPQRQILTAREREIAALAAAGMSSRDISERMVMPCVPSTTTCSARTANWASPAATSSPACCSAQRIRSAAAARLHARGAF
ncbi:AAA family ATPase [Dactylosporangium sp. McL0621]|uniref:AAA family ATPase n=1 Tax=Dactylosporangium sp. McL0621 TaxID=3415678 RepID=UPI003CF6D479